VVGGIHLRAAEPGGPRRRRRARARVVWWTGVDQPRSASVNRWSGTASPTSEADSLSW